MAVIMSDPKSKFWSLKCSCGADFTMKGEKILSENEITCPNCGEILSLINLKDVAQYLIKFQEAIKKTTKKPSPGHPGYGEPEQPFFIKVIPPGFEG